MKRTKTNWKFYNNQDGAVLAIVLVVFTVGMVLALAAITPAAFDVNHSIRDEKRSNAYYISRSAVDIVSEAINAEMEESDDLMQDMEDSYDDILALDINSPTYDADYLVALDAYNQDKAEYEAQLAFIETYVLPVGTGVYTHEVEVDGKTIPVTVEARNSGTEIILAAEEDFNGVANGAGLKLEFVTVPDVSFSIPSKNTTVTTVPLFDSPLYTFDDMSLDNNISFKDSSNKLEHAVHEGNKSGKLQNVTGYVDKAVSEIFPVPEPIEMLPDGVDITKAPYIAAKATLPTAITKTNNGYYPLIKNDGTYLVNTTAGDVIIKTNYMSFDKKTTFHVSGSNYFYIYVDASGLKNGENAIYGKNDLEFTSADGKARTVIIIDNDTDTDDTGNIDSRNDSTFDILIKNNFSLYGYLYGPTASMNIKNGPDIVGGIVVKDFVVKNNLSIVYTEPLMDMDDVDVSITGTEIVQITDTTQAVPNVNKRLWID